MIDIILATYNGEKYLRAQLESLLSQTRTDIRIHICDDCSNDKTEQIAGKYCTEYSNVFWHRNKKNTGFVLNFLRGIKRSDADYIMLCDQDDIWYPDKVEKTYQAMKRAESEKRSPVLVFTDAEIYDGRTPTKRSFMRSTHHNTKSVDFNHILMENICIGCTVMINRELADKLEYLPSAIRYHDWWLALIASAFGRIVYLDEMTLKYRQHETNIVGGAGFREYVRNRFLKLSEQREVLRQTYQQGRAFFQVYMGELPDDTRAVCRAFAGMDNASWLDKRLLMLRYGFKKSGLIRNIGLFLLM